MPENLVGPHLSDPSVIDWDWTSGEKKGCRVIMSLSSADKLFEFKARFRLTSSGNKSQGTLRSPRP